MNAITMNREDLITLNDCIGSLQGFSLVMEFAKPCRGSDYAPKAQGMVDRATTVLVERHGTFVSDKPVTAAHEAGHAVLAHISGHLVRDTAIWIDLGDQWKGRVKIDYTKLDITFNEMLRREALIRIAGHIGECMEDVVHPTSAIHERLHTLAICRFLDESQGKESGYHFARVVTQCEEALELNRGVFDEIQYRLLATNRVSAAESSKLLGSAVPLPKSPFDGEEQE